MKLEIKDLSVAYGENKVLEGVNMELAAGEFVSLIGTSGCGKSTLLNVLAGMIEPACGSFSVDGQAIHGISAHFAYMPQDDLLLPWKTILDNVTLYGKLHHHQKEARQKALAEFAHFGLAGYEYAYPQELSGGMRQRAAFLRTALCQAEIMLLDEPFGALDVMTRNEMQNWLRQLRSELGKTTLLVTHDIDEALYLSDRILVLGEHPAHIVKEIRLANIEKTRDWLFAQGDLRKELYTILKGENHAS